MTKTNKPMNNCLKLSRNIKLNQKDGWGNFIHNIQKEISNIDIFIDKLRYVALGQYTFWRAGVGEKVSLPKFF